MAGLFPEATWPNMFLQPYSHPSPAADPMAELAVQISPSPAFEPSVGFASAFKACDAQQMTGGVCPRRAVGLVCLPFSLAMPMYTKAQSSLEH